MHVEISVALNFVISYLYNKLPRRRVDLLAAELEKGLAKKFEGHWYPDKPFKGSAFRCVKVNGDKVDPVISKAAVEVGLNLQEIKEYLPTDLTLWIDPNEVSYRIGEKGQVKILYSDKSQDDGLDTETDADQEVQATNHAFNPEAQSFNPEAQSFKPIDALSVSLGSLNLSPVPCGLSPSSPISSASWGGSQSTSPSGGSMFPTGYVTPTIGPKPQARAPMFTTATFAQTKFGSTKLKTNAKRPTRLSPTEFNNFFRQKTLTGSLQHPGLDSPTRARSLSPRDPRVEFIVDQQQRMFHTQQQHLQQQFHHQQLLQHQQQQQQQLNFQLQQQHQQQQFQHNRLSIPTDFSHSAGSSPLGMGSLHDMFSGPSPLQSPICGPNSFGSSGQSHLLQSSGQHSHNALSSPLGSPDQSPPSSIQLTPDSHSALLESLGLTNVPYSTANHHLLLAS